MIVFFFRLYRLTHISLLLGNERMMANNINNLIPNELLSPSQEFQNAMSSMDIYWWYYSVAGNRLMLQPELIQLLGYAPDEFNQDDPDLSRNIHPSDYLESQRAFDLMFKGGRDFFEQEYRLRINDQWHWYYNRGAVVLKDDTGNPLLVGGITMNISSRYDHLLTKAVEGTKFEFIFRNTNEPVFISTLGNERKEPEIVEVNDASAALFSCTREDLIGLNPYTIIDPELSEKKDALRKELLQKGIMKMEIEAVDFKNKKKYLEVICHAFFNAGEELFICVVKDKTESVSYLSRLQASELALRQSEEIFNSLIKAADDRIGLFDSDGNIIIINDAFANTLGYTVEEYMQLENRERIHPDDSERLKGQQSTLYSTGYLSSEYRVKHKDGHYLYMSSKSVLLRESEHDKDYILFIIRDVTHMINFQKELIQAKEKAEESDKLKSAFLANMSHEIRTPMNSIVGFANLLSDEETDDVSRTEYIKRINRNSEQLLALISDIIDLAKIESNQLSVHYSSISLDNLFAELVNYGKFQLEIKSKNDVKLLYDPDPDNQHLSVESDPVRLTQILQNLLNNAVKFTMKGQITIGYRVCESNMVQFFVKDTGVGIDRKYFDVIFDQFRQIDGSDVRKFGGTGLGLAICKNLATLLSGKIWVDSVKGEGSAFFLELPVKSGYSLVPDDYASGGISAKDSTITILMVDDDQDSLMLVSTMMRNEGIQIVTAESGYRALELLERETLPNVVLMDLEMPVMSGLQTLRIIRELYPDLKVIAQSAHALEGDREKTIVAGFDSYISKPYNKQSLLKVIDSCVG